MDGDPGLNAFGRFPCNDNCTFTLKKKSDTISKEEEGGSQLIFKLKGKFYGTVGRVASPLTHMLSNAIYYKRMCMS